MTMTLEDVARATGSEVVGGPPTLELTGVSTDTRTLKPGDLYTPLIGERFDGHQFIPEALKRGAAAVVSSVALDDLPVPVLRVADTRRFYQQVAAWHRQRLNGLKLVAVTGSCGKTSTKDLVAHLCSARYNVLKTAANLNNEIGVPMTLLQLQPEMQVAVVELAMRGRGQIRELAELVDADVGIITMIGESHLELLGSREAIADTKGELLECMRSTSLALLNRDDDFFTRLQNMARGPVWGFGEHPEAVVRLIRYEPQGWDGAHIHLEVNGQRATLHTPLVGRHQAQNLLAAVGAAVHLGVTLDEIRETLPHLPSTPGRLALQTTPGGVFLVDDCYNASPSSMGRALETLPTLPCPGRRIAVLGDMLELGPDELPAHAEMGRRAKASGVDFLVAVGRRSLHMAEAFRAAGGSVQTVANAAEAAELTASVVQPGDVVLVKASHSIGLEAVAEVLKARC